MTHTVIIVEDGTGEGGTARTEIRWSPSHDITPMQEAHRRERVTKLAQKINDILYGPERVAD